MTISVNQVTIIGNIGNDLEMRYTANGTAVLNLSVATSRRYEQDGETMEVTEWHRIVLWGKTAEAVNQYAEKGAQVYASGYLQTREWEDKDGNRRFQTEIVAQKCFLLGRNPNSRKSGKPVDKGKPVGKAKPVNKAKPVRKGNAKPVRAAEDEQDAPPDGPPDDEPPF